MNKYFRLRAIPLALISSLGLYACDSNTENNASPVTVQEDAQAEAVPAPVAAPVVQLISGIDMQGFDTSVRAQDDFFKYVNGTWLKNKEIPADKSDYGSFTKLADDAEINIQALIKEVSQQQDSSPGSAAQKIRDYYNSYMDNESANAIGLKGIAAELDAINRINNLDDFYQLMGKLSAYGVNAPFGGGIFSDLKDPDTNVVYLGEAGLTLPDRDYYLEDADRYIKARDLYKQYVAEMLTLAGIEDGETIATTLLAFETELAEVSWTKEDNRDSVKRYNPKTLDELKALAPKVSWEVMFEGSGIPLRDKYIVAQPSYFEAADNIVAKLDINSLKNYLLFQTLDAFAPVLTDASFDSWFAFHRQGLQGVPESRPRWKRAIASINGNMGEILGQLYVQKHFSPESKARMVDLVDNLKAAYGDSIIKLDWMSEETKQAALDKLSKFYTKIAYTDSWRDYTKLEVKAGDLIGNIKRSAEFEMQRQLAKLDKPVDKTEWFMTPQTVNAYYNPAWNEIVFPAAILQPPFFNPAADDAVNYGGIGAVIGHEIGHGFDDQGRKFDGDGNLRDWWTKEDTEKFEQRRAKLASQYNSFVVINGLTINGDFTSGENIGDLGGMSIAYKAYKSSLNGLEAPIIDGLTGDQRFFMGWAQVWRRKYRDEELERRLTVDPHSPAKARVNVTLSNIPEFYAAFNIKEGDAMYRPPAERVKIW
ncbi:MAG: M13 family metallopeptidase [Xanthomonadales bacterium]|nr:M13 family metallopeptidase [Xanthomonadales bacterium]